MNDTPDRFRRALVFGGGGSTGNAWMIGVVAGLSGAGLDVTAADLTIGTSAGATTAVQLAGRGPADLLAAILAAAPRSTPGGSDRNRGPARSTTNHLERTNKIIAAAESAADMRRRMGAAALDLAAVADGSWQTQWHDTVAGRLPGDRWPDRRMLLTAVDARTDMRPDTPSAPGAVSICSVSPAVRDSGSRTGKYNCSQCVGSPSGLVVSDTEAWSAAVHQTARP